MRSAVKKGPTLFQAIALSLLAFWIGVAFAAEAPKQEPPATMEVLQLRLSNIEQALRIMELEYPALLKAKTELTAEIEKRKKEEKK